eukprot:3259490-Ditylum_brightwellii.AAC.1
MFSTAFYVERTNWEPTNKMVPVAAASPALINSAANYRSGKLSLRFRKPKAASPALRYLRHG